MTEKTDVLLPAVLSDNFLEFGRDLTFVGEEYPLTVGNDTFSIDLLFYHRRLQCLIAVDLHPVRYRSHDDFSLRLQGPMLHDGQEKLCARDQTCRASRAVFTFSNSASGNHQTSGIY